MIQWLVLQYGGASRIISDIINDLAIRPKPGANDNNAKYSFFSHISDALQHVERLLKIVEINKQELENCLYSRATFNIFDTAPQDSYELDNKDDVEWLGLQESYWSRGLCCVQELVYNREKYQ